MSNAAEKPNTRYKKLLVSLPSIAVIVNAFESPEVQSEVYKTLLSAFDDMNAPEPDPSAGHIEHKRRDNGKDVPPALPSDEGAESPVDVVEGDSIHAGEE